MTIEGLLPDDIRFDNFSVTGDGFIVYWQGFEQQQNCRVKCPGGRIYPISDIYTFVLTVIYIQFVTKRLSSMKLSVIMI